MGELNKVIRLENLNTFNVETLDLKRIPPVSGASVAFLTGKAGTGKSFQIKRIAEHMEGKCIVLAPTGLAALSIGGQTIHSFFHFPIHPLNDPMVEVKAFPADHPKRLALKKSELVIIDEASMVRADLLDMVDCSMRKNIGSNLPFGGKPVLLVGDLGQLPPIVKEDAVRQFIESRYASEFFFDAKVLKKSGLDVFVLSRVYRQADDARFRSLLDTLRSGDQSCLDGFNERVKARLPAIAGERNAIILNTTNHGADARNQTKLARIEEDANVFHAIIEGRFRIEDVPVPEILLLKRGARIMFAKNGTSFTNGDLGTVTEFDEEAIVVHKDSGDLIEVQRSSWDQVEYVFDLKKKRIEQKTVGKFIQFPLKLAWAVTVHKSQGLTLAQCAIDLEMGAFEHGQLYVALSRVPKLDALSLRRPIVEGDIKMRERVGQFHDLIAMH